MSGGVIGRGLPPTLLAIVAFALAFYSPVEEVQSDPAIALLATQSLLDHGTLHLDAYRNDSACAYDLETDYRIRRSGDSIVYYSHGVSTLSIPAVWLANRLGLHMLDQADEFALQNLMSALLCALLGFLFYEICRTYLGTAKSLMVAGVSLFGSSLISTTATGLWNVGYETVLLALGLLHVVRRDQAGDRLHWVYLGLLAGLAFFSRPTAAFAILAALPTLAPAALLKNRRIWLPVVLGLILLAVLLSALDLMGLIPRYYSPLKLTPQSPLATGLYGILLSPSRGVLVFSSFLIPVIAVCLWHLRTLAVERLFRLALIWTGLHVLAIATKGVWWGGHSFGPRLLTEIMLPTVIVTCLAWRQLGRSGRIVFTAAYLICGLASIYIHSYQGLFNDQTRRWNWTPNIDLAPRLAFDWRHPQFLATTESLERRILEIERRELSAYKMGSKVPFDKAPAHGAILQGWYPAEPGWRWSHGSSPKILLRLGELTPDVELYLLQFRAGTLGRQEVGFLINGTEVERKVLDGPARDRVIAVKGSLLQPQQDNFLRFDLPNASSTPTDSRVLGLALYSFSLRPVLDFPGIIIGDESLFVRGFSHVEKRWRWTDGHRAALDYPVGESTGVDTLELIGSALRTMPVAIRVNGVDVGELVFEGGFENVVSQSLNFDPEILRPHRMNRIVLMLPQARPTAGDARLLGLAFRRLELRPSSSRQPG